MPTYEVKVRSENKYNEIEWEESFHSYSMRGARNAASRWINRNGYAVEKNSGTFTDFWYIK